jgi:predicted O-methyltransferase YrrM
LNWLLQNFRPRFLFALRNPTYVTASLFRELTLADERFLSGITGVSPTRIRSFLNEPFQTLDFADCLRKAETYFHQAKVAGADLYAKKILIQYAAIRAMAPDVVVETGVASGVSTSYVLLALHKNGSGKLYSIELGDPQYLPPGKPFGWIVPDWLRSNWELHMGDARALLPQLLVEHAVIDVFIHDSLHTYEHMLWEFRTAYPRVRPGGLVICDDATWNPAFPEFAREVNATRARVLRGVGFIQKNPLRSM